MVRYQYFCLGFTSLFAMSLKRKDHPDAVSLADAGSGATVSLAEAFNQKKYRLFEVSEDILKEVCREMCGRSIDRVN